MKTDNEFLASGIRKKKQDKTVRTEIVHIDNSKVNVFEPQPLKDSPALTDEQCDRIIDLFCAYQCLNNRIKTYEKTLFRNRKEARETIREAIK